MTTAVSSPPHLGQLGLRRLLAGEIAGADADTARAHVEECATCRAKLKAIEDERRRFESEIPFERFEAGVQRARRSRVGARSQKWIAPAIAIAATVLVTVGLRPLVERHNANRLKGGADVQLVIASPGKGPQRVAPADVPEMLGPGERVRIGYQAGPWKYVVAVSIGADGEVSPLYPQAGASQAVPSSSGTTFLPGAFEFYGKGAERVVVVLSDSPLALDEVERAARSAFDEAQGEVLKMPRLKVPGEQFNRTLLKP